MRNQFQIFCIGKTLEEIYGKEKAKNIREKHLGKGNHFYGKHHNKETRQLLKETFIGNKSYWYGKKIPNHSRLMKRENPMFNPDIKQRQKNACNTLDAKKQRRLNMINHLKRVGIIFSKNIGKNEKQILDELELSFGYKIIRQFEIEGYFVDGYCRELNLAIEVDEEYHNEYREEDNLRQREIRDKLNCSFIRIKDNFINKYVKEYI